MTGSRFMGDEHRQPGGELMSGDHERLKAYLRGFLRRGEFFLSFASDSFARRMASSPIQSSSSRYVAVLPQAEHTMRVARRATPASACVKSVPPQRAQRAATSRIATIMHAS